MEKYAYQACVGGGRKSGQTALEYLLVFVMMLGIVTVMSLFLYALRQQSNRTLDLVASEYP